MVWQKWQISDLIEYSQNSARSSRESLTNRWGKETRKGSCSCNSEQTWSYPVNNTLTCRVPQM